MIIKFSPQRSNASLAVSKMGDVLTINGEAFDFSGLPDGASLPASEVPSPWIIGDVIRAAGSLELSLLLPLGPSPSEAAAFPAPIINPPNGPIVLPV